MIPLGPKKPGPERPRLAETPPFRFCADCHTQSMAQWPVTNKAVAEYPRKPGRGCTAMLAMLSAVRSYVKTITNINAWDLSVHPPRYPKIGPPF